MYEAIGATGLTSIRDAPWPHRRADTIPGDREIRGSTAHSGSHASTGNPLPDPQIASIGLQGPLERPFRGNRAVLDSGTTPLRPVGIGVALDSIAVPVIRPSCSPVRHYGIRLAGRFPGLCTHDFCQLRDAPARRRARFARCYEAASGRPFPSRFGFKAIGFPWWSTEAMQIGTII